MDYDVAIIGAGAAGLTAAIYAVRAGKKTAVFEKLVAGGQIVNTPKISNYPGTPGISGAAWSQALEKQASDLGAEMIYDEVLQLEQVDNGFKLSTEDESYTARTVIVATGLNERKMEVPGEAKFIGRGVSFCATCDGSFYKDKTVAVVGGGNTALSDALYLSDLAKKVYLVHRRTEFRGEFALQEKIKTRKNVELVLGYMPIEVVGDKRVTGLKIREREGTLEKTLGVDGIFVAVGKIPSNQLIADLVELDEAGYAITDDRCSTKTPGLFVAGDGRVKELRQLVTATADGAISASSAIDFLA
ncbi:MAG: thioredoxin-disulfide reductase [Candidatus Saccharibacteria bacterium]|nr:thioredoxin-disulfide reductase [Candidatus Saccharibacteria bacterium]